jgi:hypothetical protein
MPFGGGVDSVSVYDGTLVYSGTGPSYVTGLGGDQAISFTAGSGQYIQLPNSPTGPLDVNSGNGFTFECFFQLTSLPSSGTAYLAQRNQTWSLGVTSAGDVVLTASGLAAAIAAGVTLSLNTWYHVAVVFTGNSSLWYLCLAGNLAGAPASGFDGGAVGPATQSIGGDGTTNGTFPGVIAAARVSTFARYPADSYAVPAAPLPTDFSTLAVYSMSATVKNTGVLTLTGPGGGSPGGGPYKFTVGLMPGASLSGTATVNLLANGTTTGLSTSSVSLSSTQTSATFTFTPQSGQAGTSIPITATSTGLSPATVTFYTYTAQAYTIAVTAPYGVDFTSMGSQFGYWIYDPANISNKLRWGAGTAGITEQALGTGVYMMLVKAEPSWMRVVVWDAPASVTPYVEAINPQRAAGA